MGCARFREMVQEALCAGFPDQLARAAWSAEQLAGWQLDRLRRLLRHAQAHSRFHAERLAGVDPERLELADLARLPVMTKAEMMRCFDEVVTDSRLTLGLAEQALAATAETPVPLFDHYVAFASGGSSGVRGVFLWDAAALAELVGCLTRPLRARLIASGGPPPGGVMAAMVGGASAVHMTGSAEALSQGDTIAFKAIPVTLPLSEIVARLNALQPKVLQGYPSMLARLARERVAGRLTISPFGVSATSETLSAEVRREIESGFEAGVINTYGSSEGLVGHAAPGVEALTFNSDMCLVELVDADNRPVPAGQASAKVLVTNLGNLTQPLIRYELADRFVQAPGDGRSGCLRAVVEGRSDEVLRFDAAAVHPHAITSVMVRHPDVADYQVRQTPRGLDVAVLGDGCDVERLASELRASLTRAGLTAPEVRVRAADALAPHPQTGKLRRIVPLGIQPAIVG